MKDPTFNPREQEVLNAPDGFILKVRTGRQWRETDRLTAIAALVVHDAYCQLEAVSRPIIYAVREFNHKLTKGAPHHEVRVAQINRGHLLRIIGKGKEKEIEKMRADMDKYLRDRRQGDQIPGNKDE